MPIHRVRRAAAIAGALGICLSHAGCSSGSNGPIKDPTRSLDSTDRYISSQPRPSKSDHMPAQIAGYLNGDPIMWTQLQPGLAELAGAIAIRETTLDRLLEREASLAGIVITADDIEAEREFLFRSLQIATGSTTEEERQLLLDEVRRSRGLGPTRFPALLRRNAILRALVASDVSITPGSIEEAYELTHGPKYVTRLITVPTVVQAERVRKRIERGEFFAAVAAEVSTDTSAARGGLLEPISLADASYPMSIRRTLRQLKPGAMSEPIAVDNQFAIIQLERVISPGGSGEPVPSLSEAEPELRREVRMRQERLLMSVLAERLLNEANITIRSDSLEWGWHGTR